MPRIASGLVKSLVLVLLICCISGVAFPFDPPRGLEWGMSYDSCKLVLERVDSTIRSINYHQQGGRQILDDTTWEVSRASMTPTQPSLTGLNICAIRGLRLNQMTVTVSYAFFDSVGLVALGYLIDLNAGDPEDQVSKHQMYNDLLRDLSIKYGSPKLAVPLDGEVTFAREFIRGADSQALWRDSTSLVCLQRSVWNVDYHGDRIFLGALAGAAAGGAIGGSKGAARGAVVGGITDAANADPTFTHLTVLWFGSRVYEESYRAYVRGLGDF